MTRDEVVQILGWRLGNRTDMQERILREMDFVQTTVLEENEWLPWFLESEWANALTTVGEARVPLPVDMLVEIEESHLYISKDGGEQKRLVKKDHDTAKSLRPGSGQPEFYAIAAGYFHFFPTPDYAYELGMRYMARDVLMSAANVETKWLKHASDLVIGEVGAAIAGKHMQNPTLAATFQVDAQKAWNRLLTKHTALSELNMTRALGGDT